MKYKLFLILICVCHQNFGIAQERVKTDESQTSKDQKTNSGISYLVLRQGTKNYTRSSDIIAINYTISLPNGTVVDDSHSSGTPIEMFVTNLIPGLQEGIKLMGIGGKFRFVIPSKLAYGKDGGWGGAIPPNSDIVYVVELRSVKADPDAKIKEVVKDLDGDYSFVMAMKQVNMTMYDQDSSPNSEKKLAIIKKLQTIYQEKLDKLNATLIKDYSFNQTQKETIDKYHQTYKLHLKELTEMAQKLK